MPKKIKLPHGTKCYWSFKIKVYGKNPAKKTVEITAEIIQAITSLPDVIQVDIKEEY